MEPIAVACAALVVGMVVGWAIRALLARREIAAARQAIEQAREELGGALKAEVSDALRDNGSTLVGMADENFKKTMAAAKAELDRKHQLFEGLVKPLSEVHAKLNPQIEHLSAQVRSVTAETARLSGALSDNRQVGQWGELQLRRVVELAGMTRHCDFVEQRAEGARGRPDMVVRLPNDRAVVVDAKASTAAFLEARTAADAAAAQEALARHAKALKKQVDELAKRNYGEDVANAVDFTVMFVPGDQFLSAALEVVPDLVAYGMEKRVAVATPASLVALLWTVAHGWQQVEVAHNAGALQALGREMHKHMLRFVAKHQHLGRALESAVRAHNESVGALEDGLLPRGRRFSAMAIGGPDEDRLRVKAVERQVRVSKHPGEDVP